MRDLALGADPARQSCNSCQPTCELGWEEGQARRGYHICLHIEEAEEVQAGWALQQHLQASASTCVQVMLAWTEVPSGKHKIWG